MFKCVQNVQRMADFHNWRNHCNHRSIRIIRIIRSAKANRSNRPFPSFPRCSRGSLMPHIAQEYQRAVRLSIRKIRKIRKPRYTRLLFEKPWLDEAGGRSWVWDEFSFPENIRPQYAMDFALLRRAWLSHCQRIHGKVEVSCLNCCPHQHPDHNGCYPCYPSHTNSGFCQNISIVSHLANRVDLGVYDVYVDYDDYVGFDIYNIYM